MKIRRERIAGIILKNVSDIIQFSLKNDQIGLVTVTDVKVNRDYSLAKVYVTFLADNIEEKLAELQKSKGFIRTELSKRMSTYKIPDLLFVYDDSLERGNQVEALLKTIQAEETQDD